jgi:hypothetical protein
MTNKTLIKNHGSIIINKNVQTVFTFFANPSNDNLWRSEINKSTLDGPLQVGVTINEYSNISKNVPNNLIELKCIQCEVNSLAIFETPDNAAFYLRSKRQVKAISDNATEVIYAIEFDINIVKYALGFALPKFLVSLKAAYDLKKYLVRLKTTLEND